MPYPRRLLQDNEEISLDLQPHWWFFARQIGAAIPLLVVGVLIAVVASGDVQNVVLAAWGIVVAAWAIWLVIKYFDWRFTHFVVTDRRVIFRTGVLAKRGVEIPLSRINNINFNQSVWDRLIGAGDLEIESAGKDGQSIFDDVRHPDGVQQEIYRMMDLDEQRRTSRSAPGAADGGSAPAGAAAPPPPAASVPAQLAQLAELRDRGVITSAEFDAKKAQLLERM